MGSSEMMRIANWIGDVVDAPNDERVLTRVRGEVLEMCASFPAPGIERQG
jgi:glycine hydroxymethyltransferase